MYASIVNHVTLCKIKKNLLFNMLFAYERSSHLVVLNTDLRDLSRSNYLTLGSVKSNFMTSNVNSCYVNVRAARSTAYRLYLLTFGDKQPLCISKYVVKTKES